MRTKLDMMRAQEPSGHLYPWHTLGYGDLPIKIVGYGSLMNYESARRTFHYVSRSERDPVYVFGCKRYYNRLMSAAGLARMGSNVTPIERGVLNAFVTYNPAHYFNGVSFTLHPEDFVRFREREYAYDLLPVLTVPWYEPEEEPEIAYVLSCRNKFYNGNKMLSSYIVPNPDYHAVCEDGCREVSDEFLNCFYESTWVSNLANFNAELWA
jgi:hypothetical protein